MLLFMHWLSDIIVKMVSEQFVIKINSSQKNISLKSNKIIRVNEQNNVTLK